MELAKDPDRAVKVIRCPRCKQRNPGVALRLGIASAIGFVVAIAIGAVVGSWIDAHVLANDQRLCAWLIPVFAGAIVITILPVVVARRWASVDQHVRWREPSAEQRERDARFLAVR